MDSTLRNLFLISIILIIAIIPVVIIGSQGVHDLLRAKDENVSLKIQNSTKGLELFDQIDLLKRLTANDLKLIEHIARTELGLVREDELIFVFESADKAKIPENKASGLKSAFRFLTEEEFEVLLNFDLKSFEFYEELSEFEKQVHD